MKFQINRLENRAGISFHRFSEGVRDIADYAILFLYWEIKIFKQDNPWRPK